ncbi:MAG: hypothetical protein WCY07_07755 [Pigmentiphaga sp.]
MTRRLPPFLALLLLLAMLGQSAAVLARASAEYAQQDSLAQLIQLDLCSHNPAQSAPDTVPVPCEHCLTQCCAAFLTPSPPALEALRLACSPWAPLAFTSASHPPPSWRRPHVRAPPALA